MTIVFLGEGAAQNGRMAETLNAAAKEKLPLLFLVIDNGRAINTFTPDVAANSDVFEQVGLTTGPSLFVALVGKLLFAFPGKLFVAILG